MSDLDLSNPFDPDQFPSEPRKPASVPVRPLSNADEIAPAPPSESTAADPPSPAATPPTPVTGPSTWKAAASSVPKLRQQPASLPEPPAAGGEFQGFAQDALPGRVAPAIGDAWENEAVSEPEGGHDASPLAASLPMWEVWFEQLRAIPRSMVIGVGAAILLAAAAFSFLIPHGEPSVPLARIRQHPEAFDGRVVKVNGRAGETFMVGGSFVFDLRQGRDTIVVYSTRRPSLHQRVEATGTVSIGYLDGAPRLALFERPPTP